MALRQLLDLRVAHAESTQLLLVGPQIGVRKPVWIVGVAVGPSQTLHAGERTEIGLLGIAELPAVERRQQFILPHQRACRVILQGLDPAIRRRGELVDAILVGFYAAGGTQQAVACILFNLLDPNSDQLLLLRW